MQLGRQPVARCFGRATCRPLRTASALRALGPRSSLPRPADVPLLRQHSVADTQQQASQHISQSYVFNIASAPPLRRDSVGDVASPSQLASHRHENLNLRRGGVEAAAIGCGVSTSGSSPTASRPMMGKRAATPAGSTSRGATTLWKQAAAALDGLQARSNQLVLASVLSGFGLFGAGVADPSKPGSVLTAVGVLAAIVAVHEAGHFAAARLQGIRVTRFAVGFGPTIWKYQGPEVEYCLNAIPMGGYVAFPDDELAALALEREEKDRRDKQGDKKDGKEGGSALAAEGAAEGAGAAEKAAPSTPALDPSDPNLLKNRPIPQRALVISAGVLANLAFAYLVLLAQIATVGKAETAFLPGVRVGTELAPTSAAARGGVLPGDVITRVGDLQVPAGPSQVSASVAAIRAAAGQPLTLEVLRGVDPSAAVAGRQEGGEVVALRVTPDVGPEGQGRIGVQLSSNTYIAHTYPQGPGEVLAMTQSEFNRLCGTVLGGLQKIFTNFGAMSGQLSGPVAIVAAGSEVLRADAAGLFQFAAIVNINLAAVNLLPLPALDGGYLALLALEAARGGRKLPAAVEQGVMAGGFLLLTGLGLGLVVRDTINLL